MELWLKWVAESCCQISCRQANCVRLTPGIGGRILQFVLFHNTVLWKTDDEILQSADSDTRKKGPDCPPKYWQISRCIY